MSSFYCMIMCFLSFKVKIRLSWLLKQHGYHPSSTSTISSHRAKHVNSKSRCIDGGMLTVTAPWGELMHLSTYYSLLPWETLWAYFFDGVTTAMLLVQNKLPKFSTAVSKIWKSDVPACCEVCGIERLQISSRWIQKQMLRLSLEIGQFELK